MGTREVKLNFGSDSADDLRGLGWMVAVHNDYRLDGDKHTFWLLTHPLEGGGFLALQGEAKFDAEALDNIRRQVVDRRFGRVGELDYLPQIEHLQSALRVVKEHVRQLTASLKEHLG